MSTRAARLDQLHRDRPRRPFVTRSVVVLLLIVVVSWVAGDFAPGRLFSERQQANAARFLGELQPWPLQQDSAPTGWADRLQLAGQWFGGMWSEKGVEAVASTLAISLVAILLAGLWGSLLSLPAARNFASAEPFLPAGRAAPRAVRFMWRSIFLATRGLLTVMRALPEYIWAFLLLALLGP